MPSDSLHQTSTLYTSAHTEQPQTHGRTMLTASSACIGPRCPLGSSTGTSIGRAAMPTHGATSDHDQCWGANRWACPVQETYGEDPTLTGTLGAAYVNGMQNPNSSWPVPAVRNVAKHFAA